MGARYTSAPASRSLSSEPIVSPRRTKKQSPKEVVYLWGAGGTQAEVNYLGAHRVNVLMYDRPDLGEGVATRILARLPKRWRTAFAADPGADIEKLISLLSASTAPSHASLAEKIRKLYFEDICGALARAHILRAPQLAAGLFALHGSAAFQQHERLMGIITTNHDGLLQFAAQQVHACVNIGVPFRSEDVSPATLSVPPILQLHGSFTWTFDLPLKVSLLSETSDYHPETIWIPPTILKESKHYPFNKLAGLAYEILSNHCDVLRVVGSALNQNDWNILSLIFNAQRHKDLSRRPPFRIELIMSHDAGMQITKTCSYLRQLVPIGYLTEGDFAGYKDYEQNIMTEDMRNPLFYWLKEKIRFHRQRGHLGEAPVDTTMAQILGERP